jgi:hypothetical protein
METYSEFRPTGFDSAGLAGERHGISAFKVFLGQNRDSDCLTRSNFRSALQALGGESDTVQVHRFGHWACGWYELILIDPADESAMAIAEDIECGLADYPIVSEEDYSSLEYEEACDMWTHGSVSDRVDWLQRYGRNVSIFAARHDDMPADFNYSDYFASNGF